VLAVTAVVVRAVLQDKITELRAVQTLEVVAEVVVTDQAPTAVMADLVLFLSDI
jgi:hypothetical protein